MKKIYLIFLLIAFTVSNANSELYKSGVLQGGGGSDGASIVEQSDCSTITEGFCLDTDDGKLYYYNGSSVVEIINDIDSTTCSYTAFTTNDTTPSVSSGNCFSVDYVTPITDFDDPTEGKTIYVRCDAAAVFDIDAGDIDFFNRTTDYTATIGEVLQFISVSGKWWCLNAQNESVTSGDSDDLGDFLTDENGTTGGFMRSNADLSSATGAQGDDTVYGAGWNGDGSAPSKNSVYDEMETKQNLLTDGDGLETAIGSETTGTGDFVRATSPTLVAPALGTPASGNLANCTGYPAVDTPSISDIQDADGNNSIDFGSNIITYQLTDDNAELRICDGSDTSDYFYFRKNGTDLEFGVNDDGNDNDIYINLGSIAIEAGTGQLDDGANSAITRVGRTAGESISIGQAVGMASDGTYMLADGSEGATIGKCLGLAADDYGDGSAITIVSYGVMRNDAWSWSTIGASVFLDDTAGGLVETSTDIDSSETLQFIGTVYSGSELDLNISPDVFMVE